MGMFKRLLAALRTPSAVLFLICLVLLMGIFEKEDLEMATRKAMEACQRDRENAALYAKALVHLLNKGTVVIGESTALSCRVKEVRS